MKSSKEPPADSNANNDGDKSAVVNNPIVKSKQPKCKKPIRLKATTRISRGKIDFAELIGKLKDYENDDLWEKFQ